MEKYKILPFIVCALLQILPLPSKAGDEVSYNDYYSQEDVVRFFEQGTMDDFEHIPEKLRVLALAGLMNQPDHDETDRDYFQIIDRKEIFEKYYDTLPQGEKEKVYGYAFDFAVSNRDKALAASFFDQAVRNNPNLAQKLVCFSIAVNDGEDGDGFNGNASQVAVLIPLIAKTPGLANQVCEINQRGKKVSMSVAQIVSNISQELYTTLYQQSQVSAAAMTNAAQSVFREYSNCSVAQVRQNMFESMRPLKDARVGTSVYIEVREDKCVISGLIKKQKNGFEFAPSNRISGYMKQTFSFQTLDQIVSYLKVNPQSFALSQKVEVEKTSGTRSELRPDLSQAYGANQQGVKAKPSPAKKTSAEDDSSSLSSLINPFAKSVADTVKDFFGKK